MGSSRPSIKPLSLKALLLVVLATVLAVSTLLMGLARPAQAASSITVNTISDEATPKDGKCSLREAINNANSNSDTTQGDCTAGSGADTINFAPGLSGMIKLGSTLPTVTDSAGLTIDGGNNAITISGEKKVRVLQVNPGAQLTLKNLTVANGSASGNNGGGINNFGALTVTNSTFSGNSATSSTTTSGGGFGGGIDTFDGPLTVTNSTFSGNSADANGGGIETFGGPLTVSNSTFSGNSAASVTGNGGGGISNASGPATLSNTILANNKGNDCSGTITDKGYNIADDASCKFTDKNSKNSTDPKLDPKGLQNNGGPTLTIALQKGSPAIDAIPKGTNGCGTDVKTDQRGVTRPQGPACDVGAFEVQVSTPTPPPTPPPPPPPPPPSSHHHKAHHGDHHHKGHHGGSSHKKHH